MKTVGDGENRWKKQRPLIKIPDEELSSLHLQYF